VAAPDPLRQYLNVQHRFDASLRGVLERAALDIRVRINRLGTGIGADVRRAQLQSALFEIRNTQQSMWTQGVLPNVVRGQKAAALAAQETAETMDRVLYTALPHDVAQTVRDGLKATARAGIETEHARVPRQLSARVYRDFALTSGEVEQTIRSGIVAGLSARELASSVYQFISPTSPGGASYSAMRLARTEINNSFHEQQIKGASRPGVIAVVWNLSGSHKTPDQCNTYASQNADRLGRGLYKPESVPGKPHPQCLCFLTYQMMDDKEFAVALNRGDFDKELDKRTRANLERLGHQPVSIKPPIKVVSKPTLIDRVSRGVKKTEKLSGGSAAKIELLTLKDGSQVIKKTAKNTLRNAKETQDAEELAAQFAKSIGVRAPEVHRESEKVILMEFMDGVTATEKIGKFAPSLDDVTPYTNTDAGKRMGLMDIILSNGDRNFGNWLVDAKGNITAIDHGFAFVAEFGGSDSLTVILTSNPFTFDLQGFPVAGEVFGSSTAYSPEDVRFLRKQLQSLRSEFQRLDRMDWYDLAASRIDELARHARGTGRLFK
jgi:hypothetical protein